MAPPRPRIEENGEAEIYRHTGIARDRFSDTIGESNESGEVSELPSGSLGDMLYHDGTDWVVLNKPSAGGNNAVLRHNGTAPYWEKPVDCS